MNVPSRVSELPQPPVQVCADAVDIITSKSMATIRDELIICTYCSQNRPEIFLDSSRAEETGGSNISSHLVCFFAPIAIVLAASGGGVCHVCLSPNADLKLSGFRPD